eukprot:XP_017951320.1 PREDICTED: F-box/WD repeat-containing protein 4 isoform X5 [Xenopus tropicalis]
MWPHLLHLPEEILLLLFSYLDTQALGRLAQVCRKLQHFTSKDAVWRKIAKKCLNSGFVQQGTDVASWISVKERVRVSQNWKNGRCRRNILLKWKRKDGRIAIHKVHSAFSIHFTAHDQDVNCVDCHRGIIVSGSRDRTAKVWSLTPSRDGHCLHTIQTDDRVWSVAINPILSSFITGTACCGHTSPLRIWDLQSGALMTCLGTDFKRGAGVLDVRYETPYTLLSCGYDTFIRYWDLRTSTRRCVKEWEEPHDSALYCMQSDGNHMIASGSAYYGVVRLWDKRMNQCLHSFSLSSPTSSPVYCLQFNTRHLYAALASALHVLDFTTGDSLFKAL